MSEKLEASGVSEGKEAGGAVHRADCTEGDSTRGEERKKSCGFKKKYWILVIFLISLLLIALTLGVSLYFGLYYGKHDSKGDNCKVMKEKRFFYCLFLESANLNNSNSPYPGKCLEKVFKNQIPNVPQTYRIRAT